MPLKILKKYFNLTRNETYFVFAVFIFVSSFLAFTFYGPNYNKTSSSINFVVPQGATFNSIIDSLYKKDIIPTKLNMKAAAFLFGIERDIKAGSYEIPDGISYISLLSLLNEGAPKEQQLVTIQEGIWQTDLAELISNEFGVEQKEFLNLCKNKKFIKSLGLNISNLEGYLLPNTYYFYKGSTSEEIIKKLSSEMNNIFKDAKVKSRMKELKMNKHQILTMASIIDGESNKVEEFNRISGVYHNRLIKRWKLQADPTVQYLARKKRKKVNRVYYKDLEIDSKYNTYMYYGLPPSPINNPGKDAIMAALYPEVHDLYFFVADGTGGHIFSKSSREHQNNVNRYRDWRRNNK
jgi:peptidoglycan lytic transglycosylase G